MTELNWATIRETTTNQFNGETPGPTIEAAIINHFEHSPQTVLRTINEVANDVQTGNIARGWPILHYRLEQRAQPIRNVTIQRPDDRNKATARAEQWIRTAGIHFDRESEVDNELFGDRGTLQPWCQDQALRERMLRLWAEARPAGIRTEREQQVRLGRKRIIAARKARIEKRHPPLPAELQDPTEDA